METPWPTFFRRRGLADAENGAGGIVDEGRGKRQRSGVASRRPDDRKKPFLSRKERSVAGALLFICQPASIASFLPSFLSLLVSADPSRRKSRTNRRVKFVHAFLPFFVHILPLSLFSFPCFIAVLLSCHFLRVPIKERGFYCPLFSRPWTRK